MSGIFDSNFSTITSHVLGNRHENSTELIYQYDQSNHNDNLKNNLGSKWDRILDLIQNKTNLILFLPSQFYYLLSVFIDRMLDDLLLFLDNFDANKQYVNQLMDGWSYKTDLIYSIQGRWRPMKLNTRFVIYMYAYNIVYMHIHIEISK